MTYLYEPTMWETRHVEPSTDYFVTFVPSKYSSCDRMRGVHRFWVHGGTFDSCICGQEEKKCKGIDRCGLADFSWLPRKAGEDDWLTKSPSRNPSTPWG